MPQPAALNIPPAPPISDPQQGAVGQPPAHLQAFGVHPQVPSAPHVHNQYNNISSPSAVSYFLNALSGGLAPVAPGQEYPTLEQILTRGTRNHRPYSTDEEMKEALSSMMDYATTQLANSTNDNESDSIKALIKHIVQTRDLVSLYGHKLVWQYHKQVVQAMRNRPPYYDPAKNGPTYSQAYLNVFLHPDKSSKRPAHKSSGSKPSTPAATATRGSAKRSRTDDPCSKHPNGTHSNSECRAQQSKRPAQSNDE
jgi:hypothetical protein